jgi:hypothetical protein
VTRALGVIFVGLAACGGGKGAQEPEPEPVTTNPILLAQSVVDALGEMTIAAESHAADCPGMAAALTEIFDRVRPTFDQIQTLRADPETARELTTAFRPYDADAATLARRLSAAVTVCAKDTAVVDAMAKMPVIQ